MFKGIPHCQNAYMILTKTPHIYKINHLDNAALPCEHNMISPLYLSVMPKPPVSVFHEFGLSSVSLSPPLARSQENVETNPDQYHVLPMSTIPEIRHRVSWRGENECINCCLWKAGTIKVSY